MTSAGYFVDATCLSDGNLVIAMRFSEDDKQEITWRGWLSCDEMGLEAPNSMDPANIRRSWPGIDDGEPLAGHQESVGDA